MLRAVTADQALVGQVRATLAAAGDPQRALGQQRYLKSALPFHGVPVPRVRALTRPLLRVHPPVDARGWEATIRELWDGATHREEWYAALVVCRSPAAADWQTPDRLDLYRHLITTGAWWDVVDEIAVHLVGGVLQRDRTPVTAVLHRWAISPDLWLRRTAVLCQLRHRGQTDTTLLRSAIEANVDDDSFWLRKAIGWALRQHALVDPGWVRAEVDRLQGRLSGLSQREALRHL